MVSPTDKVSPSPAGQFFSRGDLLRWLYLGRLILVAAMLAVALRLWFHAREQDTLVVTVMFLVALVVTSWSFWYTHIVGHDPGQNFLYLQVILDIALVTGVIHVTSGPSHRSLRSTSWSSAWAPSSCRCREACSSARWPAWPTSPTWCGDSRAGSDLGVALQIGLFTVVALVTGLVGDRLRRAGLALGAVESELRQLRLDTGDILANLATGVLTVDGDGRLAYANPAAEALLGFSAREWMGEPVMEEVERRAPGMGRVLERAMRESGPGGPLSRGRGEGRRDFRLGVSTAVLERGADVPPSATAIFQDITDVECWRRSTGGPNVWRPWPRCPRRWPTRSRTPWRPSGARSSSSRAPSSRRTIERPSRGWSSQSRTG